VLVSVTYAASAMAVVAACEDVASPSTTLHEKASQFPVMPSAWRAAWQELVSRASWLQVPVFVA
jgi:hypothetical protein